MTLNEINHSKFRKYASWERPDPTEDEFGREDPESWIAVLGQRCAIARQPGYFERDEAGKETAKSGIIVTTRYRKEIAFDESLRINHKGVIYDIESIENVEEANVYLAFYAITADRNLPVLAMFDGNPMGGLGVEDLAPLP